MTVPITRSRQTLDQRRGADAWAKVEGIYNATASATKSAWADYSGEAHKLPVRIMASSLGQALAFLHAKKTKKPGLAQLIDDLSDWVLVRRIEGSSIQVPQQMRPDLLQAVLASDTAFLRWATDETMAYLQWINRFAESLGRESDSEPDKN